MNCVGLMTRATVAPTGILVPTTTMPWTRPPCRRLTLLELAVAGTLSVKTGVVALGIVRIVAPSGMPGPEID